MVEVTDARETVDQVNVLNAGGLSLLDWETVSC